jgi:hypothetical protein
MDVKSNYIFVSHSEYYHITVRIEFSPKDINDPFVKSDCYYRGVWRYCPINEKTPYEDAWYIVKDDMPLLKYFGPESNYWFIEFYENLAKEAAFKIIEYIKNK